MKCIIIEDQAPAQRVLKNYIAHLDNLELIGTFNDAIHAKDFLDKQTVDLMFLDIHLPKTSGLDFLQDLTTSPSTIITTAFSDYAVQSFELNVVDYLVKPFSFTRFQKAIEKVMDQRKNVNHSNFFIKSGHDYISINSNDVVFIKSDMDYTEIYQSTKKDLSSETLSYWEQKLKPFQFIRVHKSYLVNVSKIEKVSGKQIHLEGNQIIPIGRVYKEQFLANYIKG
ncbi:DNA-binding response regulator [Putridiphycobacter roseus]|uniref:DNA-binding response regulator n=1 Tax=Putridiphycobacter roseus TaxID=2219161 RepID=A0A2W1MXU1_9FLAO|nr:DNA-binding response regulator [Putridiphycobacter roseus]